MVRVVGAKSHAARLRRMSGDEMVREVGKALFVAGNMIEIEAEISITTGSVSGKGHIPSAPGSPPNRDTGVLDGNIETVQVQPLRVEVSSNARYSAALEFGTSKMAARPFMRPAAQRKKDEATALVRAAVQKVVRQAGQGNPKT
jgi:HK97 gp10 family phage protein